jgi:hypothetical protein
VTGGVDKIFRAKYYFKGRGHKMRLYLSLESLDGSHYEKSSGAYQLGINFNTYDLFVDLEDLCAGAVKAGFNVKWEGGDGKVTSKMMSDFGWPVSDTELSKINFMLNRYKIIDMRSIRLFMATCGHESAKGKNSIETGSDSYFISNGYTRETRGAGYIQITHKETHKKFLESVNDSFDGADTATYIAENYPWEAAGWFWSATDAKSTSAGSLNDYTVKYGDSLNVFLIIQFFVNGWPRRYNVSPREDMPNNYATDIRDGKTPWSISNNILTVYGENFTAPNGWDTETTGRKDCYESSIKSLK